MLSSDVVIGVLVQAVEEARNFAFEALSEGTICEGAELNMTFVKPKSVCQDCGCEFEHDVFHNKCPDCGSIFTTLIQGKELYIDKIEVDMPDEPSNDQT